MKFELTIGTLGDTVKAEFNTVEELTKFASVEGILIKKELKALNIAVPIEVKVAETAQVAPALVAEQAPIVKDSCPKCGQPLKGRKVVSDKQGKWLAYAVKAPKGTVIAIGTHFKECSNDACGYATR